jgi:hypothetical protein
VGDADWDALTEPEVQAMPAGLVVTAISRRERLKKAAAPATADGAPWWTDLVAFMEPHQRTPGCLKKLMLNLNLYIEVLSQERWPRCRVASEG